MKTRTLSLSLSMFLGPACGSSRDMTQPQGTDATSITTAGTSGVATTDDTGPEKLDVGSDDTHGGPGDCSGMGGSDGELEFSYIWVANSEEGTVSKIDTLTGTELARYRSGPEKDPEPSRTSVNLVGDAVVVNRGGDYTPDTGHGSITKIAARPVRCVDLNQNGQIDTSTGPNDVRVWGTDECVLWNQEIESFEYVRGPRPVAWEGSLEEGGCSNLNPRVWVGFMSHPDTGVFRRLDGKTGETLDEVKVPDWSGLNFGPYGGAVNKDGDFIVIGWQQGPLIKIDSETLEVQRFELPTPDDIPEGSLIWSYGMALDEDGNPWIASADLALGFDFATEQWTILPTGNISLRGVAVDRHQRAYFAVDMPGCGLAVVDTRTKTLLHPKAPVPGCVRPVGVSVDAEGFIWVVDEEADAAFKLDSDTYELVAQTSGLSAPYTYSDMTGAGLDLVVYPPNG